MRHAAVVFAVLLLAALPVAAETYTVTLTNGNTFVTRYRPREAGWDETKIVLQTDFGNQLALAKADVASVVPLSENRGFGRVIDNTTFELGVAPNDAPDPEETAAGGGDQVQAFVRAMEQMQQQAPPPNYNVDQFVEPSQSSGLPVGWAMPSPTPPTGTVVFQGNAAPPPPQ